jgi:hypothetical protein
MSRRVKPLIDHAFTMPEAAPREELTTHAVPRKRFLLRRRMEWAMS